MYTYYVLQITNSYKMSLFFVVRIKNSYLKYNII